MELFGHFGTPVALKKVGQIKNSSQTLATEAVMKHSILIVDDEQAIRESIHMLLQGEGYDCTHAENGKEAIRKACSEFYNLIILDLHLPMFNGLEVLKKIRECSSDTVILIITCYSDIEQAAEALLLGASRMMLKPIDFEELLEIIDSLLDSR